MTRLADRVKETSTTTGTGTYSLAGAVTGFQGFVAGIGTGLTCYYCAEDGTDWEVGIGTVTDGSPDTLARTTILASSNADAAVNWGAGTRDVFVTIPADAKWAPTPARWGANTETLTVDKTLVDGDDTIQWLDCGDAARAVNLPAPTTSNKLFLIVNRSYQNHDMAIMRGSVTLATLAFSGVAWCLSDGAQWTVAVLSATTVFSRENTDGFNVFSWAADAGVGIGNRLTVHGDATAGPPGAGAPALSVIEVPETTTIDKVVQVVQTNGNQVWALYKDGAESEAFASTSFTAVGGGFSLVHEANTSVSASSYMWMALKTSTSTLGDQHVYAVGRSSTAGINLPFGGTGATLGRMFIPHGNPGAFLGSSSRDAVTEHLVGVACVDTALSHFTTAGDATTVLKVWKNGSIADTLSLAGAVGVLATAATSYAAGDQVAIEHDSGTASSWTNLVLSLNAVGSLCLTWAGDASSFSNVFLFLEMSANTSVVSTSAEAGRCSFTTPYAMVSTVDAFNAGSATNVAAKLRRNGALDQAIAPSAAEEVIVLTPTVYFAGDYVEMTADSLSAPPARHRIHFSIFGGQ